MHREDPKREILTFPKEWWVPATETSHLSRSSLITPSLICDDVLWCLMC